LKHFAARKDVNPHMQTDTFTFSCNIQHLDQQYSSHVQGAYTIEVTHVKEMQHFNRRKGRTKIWVWRNGCSLFINYNLGELCFQKSYFLHWHLISNWASSSTHCKKYWWFNL